MTTDRRTFLNTAGAATLGLMLSPATGAANGDADAAGAADVETIALWPRGAPAGAGPGQQGAERVSVHLSHTNISQARLLAYRPARPNGAAVLLISGGGYAHIARGKESAAAATWFAAQGVTAFELIYRLPAEGWSNPPQAPFQDAQRAMRLIRSRASDFGLAAGKIGVLGFSAGGHLAGTQATQPDAPRYTAIDAADALPARPDFAALIYPVLTMMPPFDRTHTRKVLLGDAPTDAQRVAYSVERHVGKQTPPTFLAQAGDDDVSPVDNSLLMFGALRAAGVPSELHVFQSGGHGFGMGVAGKPTQAWPELFRAWAALNGWF